MSSELRRLRRELAARGIEVRSDGRDLQLRAPRGAIDAALREQLRAHKGALLAALSAGDPPPWTPGSTLAPLTSTQRQLWFGAQLEPNSEAHLLVVEGELHGPVEHGRLERTLAQLLARHEALRTQIHVGEAGEPYQEVLPAAGLPAPLLSQDPAAFGPIDPLRAPLWQVALSTDPADPGRHRFTLRAHHIIIDGAGLELLLAELGRAYAGLELAPLGPGPLSLARSEAQRLRQADFAPRLAALAASLSHARPVELPGEARPKRAASGVGGRVQTQLAAREWAAVQALAREHATTPFVCVAAAVAVVLRRWVGRERVWLGVPHANRDTPARARAVASLVETTLLECSGVGDPSFSELIEHTRRAWLRALEHGDVPLDRLVASLPVRGLPDLTLNFIPFARLGLELPGVETRLRGHMPGARFDLTVYAYPPPAGEAGALHLAFAYRSERFDAARIEALCEQLLTTLRAMSEDPRARPSALAFALPAALRRQTQAAATPEGIELLAAIDAIPPHTIALRDAKHAALRYASLRGRAAALAEFVGRSGAQRVAILAARDPSLVVAMLAIWTAGASIVMLDATHPPARLVVQAQLAEVELCLALAPVELPLAAHFEAHDIATLHAEAWPAQRGDAALVQARALAPARAPSPLAWLPFTSGSSGSPAGLLVEHEVLARSFRWYLETFEIGADERFASLAGLAHDPSLRELIVPLCVGASVVFPPRAPAHMGAALGPWLAHEGVTTLHLSPALARIIARGRPQLPALRRVLFGGAPLRGSELAAWHELAPNAVFYNCYGATETPQIAALHRCDPADRGTDIVPIGRGVAGTELVLRTPAGLRAGVGELAQICIEGPNLARAYLGPPRPGASRLQAGVFHSGDLGRLRPDGCVEFVGRRDRQVEIHGHRIELAELEHALSRCEFVREFGVCAAPREDDPDLRELLAAVVGPEPASLAQLRATLEAWLPRAWIPAHIALLPRIPLTPNGKLDEPALILAVREASRAGTRTTLAPRSGLELALASVWTELLGVSEIGPHDDFFALGGHSLLCVELVARLEGLLGLRAPVTLVFEHPRLDDQAAALAALEAPLPLRPLAHEALAPASFAQERLWLLERLEPDAPQLHIDHDVLLAQPLERARLDTALATLEARHEVLRTRFELHAGELVQRPLPPRSSVLEAEPPAEIRFDLERGPLWRVFAWTEGEGRARLRLVLHHIAGDAAAVSLLIRELHTAYRGAQLPPLSWRYAELALWQRAQHEARIEQGARSDWSAELRGLEPLELPLAHPRPPRQSHAGAHAERVLAAELSAALRGRARTAKTTLYTTLLTGLAAVLARWSGAAEFAVGSPLGLRPHPAANALVGPFLSLAVLRIDAGGDPTFAELLARLRAQSVRAFARAQHPFEAMLSSLSPQRRLDRTPLFQVLFNMVDGAQLEAAWSELGATRLPARELHARYELAVYARPSVEGDDRVRLSVVYASALFSAMQIEQLLTHLESALEQLAHDPTLRLSQLALEPAARPRSAPPLAHSPPPSVFEALARRAAEAGERCALRAGPRTLSFAALHQLGTGFALVLATPPGARVGLLCQHDVAMIAAMIAVLARGGTYVPLDPQLPPARLAQIIADAELHTLACAPELCERGRQLAAAAELPLCVLDECDAEDAHAQRGQTWTPARVNADAPAYILYTSGSTGRPKGVVQSRANLLHHACSYAESAALGPGVRVSLVASFAFDAAVMDIYGALLSGAQLCLIDLGDAAKLGHLAQELSTARVQVFHATPTLWRELCAQLDAGAPAPPLRCVILGGEAARSEDARALRRHFGPHCTLLNGLGPTECTVALQHRVRFDSADSEGSESARMRHGDGLLVGHPRPGVRALLHTPLGEQVALHGVGELVLESPHLALEYWRRPDKTESVFSTTAAGARRYATGDLVRIEPGGALRFIGRRDAQVEIRGRRVELGEIEARLRAHAGVREAGVSLRGDHARPRLVAHLCALGSPAPAPASILAALREQLPAWMIPSAIVFVEALPKTPTAKLDRRALAQLPCPPSPTPAPLPAAPSPLPHEVSALALELRRLWAEAIGVAPERIGLERDFFSSGGDSLAALRFARAAKLELGLEIELRELFEGHAIAALARRLRGEELGRSLRASLHLLAQPARSSASRDSAVIVLPPGASTALAKPLALALAERGVAAYGLRPPSFGHAGPLPTLAELLDACADVLDSLELSRPHLLGISNGGLLAWLLAERRASPFASVALLDTIPPQLLAADPFLQRSPARRHAAFMTSWAGLRVEPSALEGEGVYARMRELADAAGREVGQLSTAAIRELYALHERHAARVWRVLAALELGAWYRGAFDAGPPLRLFAAAQPPSSPLVRAWLEREPKLAVHAVPGDHSSMLGPPNVAVLATRLVEEFSPDQDLLSQGEG